MDFVNSINIYIDKSLCIRSRFAKSSCQDCADVCVADAISFLPEVRIDRNACINCGLCYAVCRFSAIYTKKDNQNFIKSTYEQEKIDVGCIFSDSNIKVSCISRITDDLFLSWFSNGKELLVKKGDCSRCKFKKTLPTFYKNLKLAVALSRLMGIKPKIKISTKTSKKPYIPKEQLSRRELLSSIQIDRKKSFSKRESFLEIVNDKIKGDIEYPYSAKLNISDECTVCGLCEHICPLDAILIKEDDLGASIYFNPSKCIGCRECQKACIYDAIIIKTAGVSEIFKKPYKVFESKKRICSSCSKEFYSNKEKDICRDCELKKSRKSSLVDFFKNI